MRLQNSPTFASERVSHPLSLPKMKCCRVSLKMPLQARLQLLLTYATPPNLSRPDLFTFISLPSLYLMCTIKESIRSLQRADKVECVRFFPVVAAHIFKVMCDNHNEIEGGNFASTTTLGPPKDYGSPRSARAMSDGMKAGEMKGKAEVLILLLVTGVNAPNMNLIPRPHSAQTIGHTNAPLVRLASVSSAPNVSNPLLPAPPPLELPSSDSESDGETYAPELGSPREHALNPRDPVVNSRERSGSFSGDSAEPRYQSHFDNRNHMPRAATISGGSSPSARDSKHSNPSPKKSPKSKLTLLTPQHDSAPNLLILAQAPPQALSSFNNRHSFTTLNTPNTLNVSSSSVPPPKGTSDLEQASELPEIDLDSARVSTPPPRSPKSSSATFGVTTSKFKFPQRYFSIPQLAHYDFSCF